MTEHVHEWRWQDNGEGYYWFFCDNGPDCNAELDTEEAEARLNATERLSAEDAKEAERFVPSWEVKHNQIKDALKDYANILEGKDE